MSGTIQAIGGKPRTAMFADVSAKGCRVGATAFCKGQTVYVKLASIGPVRATVMWTADKEAGLHFAERLHPAVVDHLAAQSVANPDPA